MHSIVRRKLEVINETHVISLSSESSLIFQRFPSTCARSFSNEQRFFRLQNSNTKKRTKRKRVLPDVRARAAPVRSSAGRTPRGRRTPAAGARAPPQAWQFCKFGRALANCFQNLESSFSAVSKPIFASNILSNIHFASFFKIQTICALLNESKLTGLSI